jgi:hypothetical protein
MTNSLGFRFMLASLLPVTAISAHVRSDVVLVESIVQPGDLPGYALVRLSGHQDPPITLTTSKDPLEPLVCDEMSVIYLDEKGTIWRLMAGSSIPILIGATRFVPEESLVGKTILDLDDRALFAVVNVHPEKTARWPDHRFSLVKYSFDGQEIQIGTGDGRAGALWRVSADILEVVTNKGLVDYDLKKRTSSKVALNAAIDLSEVVLAKSGFGLFWNDRVIRVRNGLNGPPVAEFTAVGGYREVVDIEPKAETVLSIFLNDEINGARIDELDMRTGGFHERYAAKGIGTARYCGNNQRAPKSSKIEENRRGQSH